MINLRVPTEADWPAILKAADMSAPWKAPDNPAWLRYRQQFPEDQFPRRHYVAEDETGGIVGYGAVEGSENGRFRVFVVMAPALLSNVGELIYGRLHTDLIELGAKTAWAREEPDDVELLSFFQAHGFAETFRGMADAGLEVVIMQKGF